MTLLYGIALGLTLACFVLIEARRVERKRAARESLRRRRLEAVNRLFRTPEDRAGAIARMTAKGWL